MAKQLLTVALLLLALTAHSQLSACPAANPLQIASDSITVSSSGRVALTSGVDVQCYNYTLAKAFSCTPGVAIGTYSLTQPSTISRVSTAPTFSSPSRP
jgi:hypothetical protein